MTHDEIRDAIADGVKIAFQNPELHCRYRIASEVHDKQHEAFATFLQTMERIDTIKWEIAKKLATILAIGLVTLIGYGAYHKFFGG